MKHDRTDEWIPRVEEVPRKERGDWPGVWLVNPYLDGPHLEGGFAWLFDVQAVYASGGGWYTTWAVPGPRRKERDLAIRQLQQRAREWSFKKIRIYHETRPMTAAMRALVTASNCVLRRLKRVSG